MDRGACGWWLFATERVGLAVAASVETILTVWPEDAWMELAPHNAAKDASVLIRPGLSPAATSSAAAVLGPTPGAASRAGLAREQRRRISVLSWLISASRV